MRKSRFLIFTIFTILLFTSCTRYFIKGDVKEISSKENYKILVENRVPITIVDVRTHEEFAKGHIPFAINIDYISPQLDTQLLNLPKDNAIIVYCSHGLRCRNVAKRLINSGYQNTLSLCDGLIYWIKRGFPIEKEKN